MASLPWPSTASEAATDAGKQPPQPQKRLRDGQLRGEEPITKPPHDLTGSGAFSCSRVKGDFVGIVAKGTGDTTPNARAVREK
jgi:hypothetical protein